MLSSPGLDPRESVKDESRLEGSSLLIGAIQVHRGQEERSGGGDDCQVPKNERHLAPGDRTRQHPSTPKEGQSFHRHPRTSVYM